MIKVLVPDKLNRAGSYDMAYSNFPPDDRPFCNDFICNSILKNAFLSDRLHYYLNDLNISYTLLNEHRYNHNLEIRNNFWYICFEKESDAVLFKLTWY